VVIVTIFRVFQRRSDRRRPIRFAGISTPAVPNMAIRFLFYQWWITGL
jgi:hypothetical protein